MFINLFSSVYNFQSIKNKLLSIFFVGNNKKSNKKWQIYQTEHHVFPTRNRCVIFVTGLMGTPEKLKNSNTLSQGQGKTIFPLYTGIGKYVSVLRWKIDWVYFSGSGWVNQAKKNSVWRSQRETINLRWLMSVFVCGLWFLCYRFLDLLAIEKRTDSWWLDKFIFEVLMIMHFRIQNWFDDLAERGEG